MADFSFRLKAEVSSEEAIRRLTGVTGTVEDLEAAIGDLVDTTGKSTNELRLDIVTAEKGKGTIARVTRETINLDKAQSDRIRTLKKLTGVEEGSLLSLRQSLNTNRQLRNALEPGTAAYEERVKVIQQLELAVRRASGIQDGSVAAYQAESRAIQEQLKNLNLSKEARDQLTDRLNLYAEAERRASGIQEGSIADLQARQAEQERLARSLQAGTAEQIRAANAAQDYARQIKNATPQVNSFIGTLNKLATVQAGFQAVTSIFGQIAGSIDKVVKRLKEVEAFNLALQNIGLSASDASRAFVQASQTANELGAPVQQVEKAYKRITPALKDIGATAADTDKFIANLTARTQVLGLTTEESGRLQEAFAQVLSKGKLQAEELTQQIAEVDGAFRTQFAEAIGITSAELSKFASAGIITSSVFVKGVNNMNNGVEILKGNIESGNATIQQLQNLIANISVKTLENIGVAIEPGIRALLDAGRIFAQFVQDIASSPLGQLLGSLFNEVAKGARDFISTLTTLFNAVNAIISPFASLLQVAAPLARVIVAVALAVNTVTLSLKAFEVVSKVAEVALGANRNAFNLAALGAVRFGQAVKLIATGQGSAAIARLTQSVIAFSRAIGLDPLLKFIQASKNAIGPTSRFGQAVANNTKQLSLFRPTLTSVAEAFSVKVMNALRSSRQALVGFGSSLVNVVKNSKGAATQLSLFGNVAAEAGGKVTLMSRGVNFFLGLGNRINAIAVSAGTGLSFLGKAANIAALGLRVAATAAWTAVAPFLPFIAIAAAVAAGIALIASAFNSFGTAGRLAGDSMRQLDSDLQKLGTKTESTKGQWASFVDFLKLTVPALGAIINLFKGVQSALRNLGFANQEAAFRKTVQAIDKDFKQAGLGGLTDFKNAAQLSGEQASNLIGKLNALSRAQDGYAAAIRKEMAELKAKGKLNAGEEYHMEMRARRAEDAAAGARMLSRQLAAATIEQRKNNIANIEGATAVERIKQALEAKNALYESASQKVATAALNEYNQGLITEAELEQRNAAITLAASQKKLQAIQEEQDVLSHAKANRLKDGDEIAVATQELQEKRIEAEKQVSEAQKAYREAELARIKEVAAAAEELVGIYQDGANIASTSFDNFSSGLTGAVDQLRDSIAQEAAIEFSITGDETILNKVIDTQGKALEFEYKIGRTKNQINQAQRQFELELQAIKIQTLKLEAQQKGGPNAAKLVAAYDKQLGLIQQISNLNQVTAKAENLQLDYKIRSQQRAYNIARETAGLEPWQVIDDRNLDQTFSDFDNFTREADAALSQFGPIIESGFDDGLSAAKSGFQELQEEPKKLVVEQEKFNKALKDGIDELSKAAKELASKNYGLNLGKELQKALGGAFDSFNKSLASTPKVVNDVKASTVGVKDAFNDSATAAGSLNSQLVDTNRLLKEAATIGGSLPGVSGNVPARAMGGPVLGGSSYLVNDGGGREAFVDMSGRASLLPASRNIKWRAPSDGFIIPAPMTDTLIQNSKINAKIASISNANKPNHSINSSASGLSNSGNLIKQMGAIMSGGNTQRITNHVTIQSQSPVMDASKIMANVTKLRARRGIRQ